MTISHVGSSSEAPAAGLPTVRELVALLLCLLMVAGALAGLAGAAAAVAGAL